MAYNKDQVWNKGANITLNDWQYKHTKQYENREYLTVHIYSNAHYYKVIIIIVSILYKKKFKSDTLCNQFTLNLCTY